MPRRHSSTARSWIGPRIATGLEVAVVGVLLIVAAGFASGWFYSGVNRPFKGYDEAERFVEIPQGA